MNLGGGKPTVVTPPSVLPTVVTAPPSMPAVKVSPPGVLKQVLVGVWAGEGPPPPQPPTGISVGDQYIDTLTGNLYRLDPGE